MDDARRRRDQRLRRTAVFFLLFRRVGDVSPWADRVLNYVAPAVLAALVLPKLMYVDGGISVTNPRLVAGAVAGVVA